MREMTNPADADAIAAGIAAVLANAATDPLAQSVSVSLAAGDVALTSTQSRAALIVLTGTLTANRTVTLSSVARSQRIRNDTTGSFDVFVKRGSAGASYSIPQGETVRTY